MLSKLPRTAIDIFRASPEVLETIRKAKLFGWWDHPLEGAATDRAEMNDIDRAYWFYKCANPVTRTSKDVSDTLFLNDSSIVKLPDRFEKSKSVTMSAVGDLIQANGLEHSKDLLFDGIEDVVFGKDISFANYESPVAEEAVVRDAIGDGRSATMCCSAAQYSTLTQHMGKRFSVLNLANNHALDLGIEGLNATQTLCSQNGILDIGAPRCVEEYGKGRLLTKLGINIGFVSATFGLNARQLPAGHGHRVHVSRLVSKHVPADLELLKSQIRDCKEQGSDFIVASVHWGFEHEFFPRLSQIEAAHALVEEGVDLLLGHHPHVIQPIEYYRTQRDPNRVATIAYSSGSLTWDWCTAPHLILSIILDIELAKGQIDGANRTYIEKCEIVPVFRSIFYRDDKKLMRIEKLRQHIAAESNGVGGLKEMEHYVNLISGQAGS
ncbi:CapA family protein [Bradyrhizobium sp. WU425]|uniref:CapA family protein n=1 Tax=Bradyrhizobium sp. WU425 TaxID=187029 RepID=UPI001E5502E7|nr:CapA family protein [Bradyrhizobium canariense]UFW71360.1 CapA family protein [Bradyrhizobium canariense]